jgi:dienelactone hydrolase
MSRFVHATATVVIGVVALALAGHAPVAADPEPALRLLAIGIGPGGGAPVSDGRHIWVPDELGVTQVDAVTGQPVARLSLGANASVATDGESVWIGSYSRNTVAPVDPGAGVVDESRRIEIGAPAGMALGLGSLWVVSPIGSTVHRIDPTDGRIAATIPVESWGGIAVGDDAVWLTHGESGGLQRIDPVTNTAEPVDIGVDEPIALATADGDVWVGSFSGQVARYLPATGDVEVATPRIDGVTGRPIFGLAPADDRVWVVGAPFVSSFADAITEPGYVSAIDPETLEALSVRSIESLGVGAQLAADAIWTVVSYDTLVAIPTDTGTAGDVRTAATAPEGSVRFVRGIAYAEVDDDVEIPLDVYAPADAVDAPNVILVPGGPLPFENRHYLGSLAAALADRGVVAYTIDYRSSATGDSLLEAHADVACAIGWVRDHATVFGGDPSRIVAVGHSYGGDLVLNSAIGADELVTCDGVIQRPDAAVPIAGFGLHSLASLAYDLPIHLVVGSEDGPFAATELERRLTEDGYEDVRLTIVEGASHDDIYDAGDTYPTLGIILELAGPESQG